MSDIRSLLREDRVFPPPDGFAKAAHYKNIEEYERAYETLEQAGAQAAIDELFAPKTPVLLPTFGSSTLASDRAETSAAYIDVAFEISRYGVSREVRIVDATNATDADKTRLVELIRRSRFRPRVTDGQFARKSPVVLRYYLSG